MQNPKMAFKRKKLRECTIGKDDLGQPFGRSGQFASVYEAQLTTGTSLAVKIFVTARPEAKERYQLISDHLKSLPKQKRVSGLVHFEYVENEVLAPDGRRYPIVEMEWVKGTTLQEWVRRKCNDGAKKDLAQAAANWVELVGAVQRAEVAHGDYQQSNVMVTTKDQLMLIDYDGMCVPKLVGQPAEEYGLEPYQHPGRKKDTPLSMDLDKFPALVIYVALRALAAAPELWAEHVDVDKYDKLLFRKEDFKSPQTSVLYGKLTKSPDPEVRRLTEALYDARRGKIEDVLRLQDYLFSWESVEELLKKQKFGEAVDVVERGSKIAKIPPKLVDKVDNARKRVACRRKLAERVKQGDEEGMIQCYKPDLLDDYPAAGDDVRKAKEAPQVIELRKQLQQSLSGKNYRNLVRTWDKNQTLLRDRTSMKELETKVEDWRKRNRLAEEVLELLDQDADDMADLQSRWQELRGLGGHPDTDKRTQEIDAQVERAEAWVPFCEALEAAERTPGEDADNQVASCWDNGLFRDWPTAEARRSDFEASRKRMSLAAEVRSLAVQQEHSPTSDRLKKIGELFTKLPRGYEIQGSEDAENYRQQLEAHRQLVKLLKGKADDSEIVTAADDLRRAGGERLLTEDHRHRIELARRRLPKITQITAISLDLPVEQLDAQLLAAWKNEDEKLLQGCGEVDPWRPEREAAGLRAEALDKLAKAIEQGDDAAVYQAAKEPCLAGYPLPQETADRIETAKAGIGGAEQLLEYLRENDRKSFVENFDSSLIRTYSDLFASEKNRLIEWMHEEILKPDTLHLKRPRARGALVPPQSGNAHNARWTFPEERFSDKCVLAVCRSRQCLNGDDPRKLERDAILFLAEVDRGSHRRGGGGRELRPKGNWTGYPVAVWAEVNLGKFGVFVSKPLELGRIAASQSKRKR